MKQSIKYWIAAAVAVAVLSGCDEHTIVISGEPEASAAAEQSAPAVLETRQAGTGAAPATEQMSARERRRAERAEKRAAKRRRKADAAAQTTSQAEPVAAVGPAAAGAAAEPAGGLAVRPMAADAPVPIMAAPASVPAAAEPSAGKMSAEEKAALKSASKVNIESVVKVSGNLFEGFVVTVRVRNSSSHNIVVNDGQAEVYMDGSRAIVVRQQEEALIPKNATTDIAVPLGISMPNPLLALALYARAKQKKFDGIEISFSAEASALGIKRRVSQERVPVKKIMDKTGYSIEGL